MVKRIKTFFAGKRITEHRGRFTPEIRVKLNWIEFAWWPIHCAKMSEGNKYHLCEPHQISQIQQSSVATIDEAAQILYAYLEFQRNESIANKKIIHDVEPEAWVILKQK